LFPELRQNKLTTTWSIMSPIVFEAILFLHMNRVLWDERTVMEALAAVRAFQGG
jgi:hypothetical protein